MIFYYIRHGFPIYNPDELTPLGKRQAEAVGRTLATYGVDRVFASTSNRAQQTAEPLCQILRLEPTVLDWANEKYVARDFFIGTGDGKRDWIWRAPETLRLFNTKEIRDLRNDWYDHPALTAEREILKAGQERVWRESDAFFASLGYEHDREKGIWRAVAPNDKRVALFAHEGFGKLFLSAVLDIPYPTFSTRFQFDFTGVTIIQFPNNGEREVVPKVLKHSDTSHLRKAGLQTGYFCEFRI